MNFSIQFRDHHLAVAGIGPLVVIVLVFLMPNFLASPLSDERAEAEVLAYLGRILTHDQLAQLQEAELRVPDRAMAMEWQQDRADLEQLVFNSIDVRIFLFTPPLVSSRLYLVRAELVHGDRQPDTRVFSMSVEGRLSDFFWVDEKPQFFWWLAK